jgi:hypothetical protein
MNLEVTGRLLVKYDTQQVSDKFKKREFVLELEEEINGNQYKNYAKLQLVQTKCDIIDRYNNGDLVKVSFNIKGNTYVDKRDGQTKYITNLDAWRVEPATSAPATSAPQQAPAYNAPSQSQPAGNYGSQPFKPSTEAMDDLPF